MSTRTALVVAGRHVSEDAVAAHVTDLTAAGATVDVVDVRPAVRGERGTRSLARVVRDVTGSWTAARRLTGEHRDVLRAAGLVVAADGAAVAAVWRARRWNAHASLVNGVPAALTVLTTRTTDRAPDGA